MPRTIEAVARGLDELPARHTRGARSGDGRRVRCGPARARGAELAGRAAVAAGDRDHSERARGASTAAARPRPDRSLRSPTWLGRCMRSDRRYVVITGGHRQRSDRRVLRWRGGPEIAGEHYPGAAAHGSGCTHSSVLAARLAWGDTPLQAARTAKELAAAAVRNGLSGLGAGPGPVDVLGLRSLT